MAKKKTQIPKYGTITLKGIQYYRTRITDADGKELSLYAATCEELYEKQLEARKQVEEIIFHRQHPTVAEYGEKWLLMQSAKVSASTLRGYTRDFKYPEAVRRLIYTTNTIEGFNRQLRKVTKSKTVFPSDDSLLKMLYLAMIDITKKWTGHRQDWGQIHSQLEIFFEERLERL